MIRGRYNPFNLAVFNAKIDHGLLLGLTDNDQREFNANREQYNDITGE